ncbi:MAG: hypothetical protein ACPGUD_03365 [Parashewanella sp.]
MATSEIEPQDQQTLKRILDIRSKKEDKLRRRISEVKKKLQQLQNDKQQALDDRNKVIEDIRQMAVPEESLDHSELSDFKTVLSQCYQQERGLAEKAISIEDEIQQTKLTIEQMDKEVFQLVKDQEKLQAVFDE